MSGTQSVQDGTATGDHGRPRGGEHNPGTRIVAAFALAAAFAACGSATRSGLQCGPGANHDGTGLMLPRCVLAESLELDRKGDEPQHGTQTVCPP
jgi:hypothetical protein